MSITFDEICDTFELNSADATDRNIAGRCLELINGADYDEGLVSARYGRPFNPHKQIHGAMLEMNHLLEMHDVCSVHEFNASYLNTGQTYTNTIFL